MPVLIDIYGVNNSLSPCQRHHPFIGIDQRICNGVKIFFILRSTRFEPLGRHFMNNLCAEKVFQLQVLRDDSVLNMVILTYNVHVYFEFRFVVLQLDRERPHMGDFKALL